MNDGVIYNSENSRWYAQGTNFGVRDAKGVTIRHVAGFVADTYADAFALIFGRALSIPAPARSPRRERDGD